MAKFKSCHRCGKKITPETWVRSRPTNRYYCCDLDACSKSVKSKAGKNTPGSRLARTSDDHA